MKVLIISVPLGNGHTACAKAIKNHFDTIDVECKILDMYEHIDPMLKAFIEKAYYYTMKSAMAVRNLASEIYYINEQSEPESHIFSSLQNELLSSGLYKYLLDYAPDIIICTQVYAAQVINDLKEDGKIHAVTCGVITDFTVQTYWEDTAHLDYIVTYSEMLNIQAAARGISLKKILPFGIPIDDKFSTKTDKDKAREILGFDRKKFCVLIMSGGMGYGKIADCVKKIDENFADIQFAVVCGSNKTLYSDMDKLTTKNTMHLFGYSNEVDLLMDACDCIITKPGGITISEALAKQLPIIMYDPLPGMEENNVLFLNNMGCAIAAQRSFPVELCLGILLYSKSRLKNLREAMVDISKPNATRDLCRFLMD
ncbi:MAG: glycosyltransferase, partial [Oscillospiraceae bacterium]